MAENSLVLYCSYQINFNHFEVSFNICFALFEMVDGVLCYKQLPDTGISTCAPLKPEICKTAVNSCMFVKICVLLIRWERELSRTKGRTWGKSGTGCILVFQKKYPHCIQSRFIHNMFVMFFYDLRFQLAACDVHTCFLDRNSPEIIRRLSSNPLLNNLFVQNLSPWYPLIPSACFYHMPHVYCFVDKSRLFWFAECFCFGERSTFMEMESM